MDGALTRTKFDVLSDGNSMLSRFNGYGAILDGGDKSKGKFEKFWAFDVQYRDLGQNLNI